MKYFKNNNNEIFAYDDEQIKQGYGKDLTSITKEEKDEILAPTPEEALKTAKINKKNELKSDFLADARSPILINDISYHGGEESAMKLDAKRRMVIESGGDTVDFFDTTDTYISHTIEEATQICLTIANVYETKLARYKELCKLVDSKLKVSTVEAIVW